MARGHVSAGPSSRIRPLSIAESPELVAAAPVRRLLAKAGEPSGHKGRCVITENHKAGPRLDRHDRGSGDVSRGDDRKRGLRLRVAAGGFSKASGLNRPRAENGDAD